MITNLLNLTDTTFSVQKMDSMDKGRKEERVIG